MTMTPVGLTSRWIAAARALETENSDPLFSDPLARDLAGEPGFTMMTAMRAALTVHVAGPDPYLSIRTKFLDDAISTAVRESSIKQALILAAGMDARAFRLDWPEGLVLFEVDRDEVFDHKESVLERLGARPRCDRRVVRADVSGPWAEALVAAGFDPARPAAILVEGLVFYLDEAAVTALLKTLETLACEGSWLGLDVVNTEMLTSPYLAAYLAKLREAGCPWVFGVKDPETWLAGYGWRGTAVAPGEPEAHYGRWPYPAIPRSIPGIPRSYFIHGRRTSGEAQARTEVAVQEQAPVPTPVRSRQPDGGP